MVGKRGEEGTCALGASDSTAGRIALLCLALGSHQPNHPQQPLHSPVLLQFTEPCSFPSRHKSSSQNPCWYQPKALLRACAKHSPEK